MKSGTIQSDYSEEDGIFIGATEAVFVALEKAGIDLETRKIIWPDGETLTIGLTAEKIHLQTGIDLKDIENHVLGWLEVGFDPSEDLDDNEMETLENKIDKWIEDYQVKNSD